VTIESDGMCIIPAQYTAISFSGGIMKTISYSIVSLFLTYTILIQIGCSAIGYGIGDLSDSKNVRIETRPVASEDLMPGKDIRLDLTDFSIIEGRFLRLDKRSENPDYMSVVMEVYGDTVYIPQDSIREIKEVEVIKSKNGRALGFFLGFLTDATLFYLAFKSWTPSPRFHPV
jgi:hypothetical protein